MALFNPSRCARANGGHEVWTLLGHGDQVSNVSIGIDARFAGEHLPLAYSRPIFIARILPHIDIVVGKHAGEIVKQCRTYPRPVA